MEIHSLLNRILDGDSLDAAEATFLMEKAMSGELGEIRLSAFLSALRAKGETSEEIGAFAKVMRENAIPLHAPFPVIDTCGTGGDHSSLFNISTLSALVLAARGYKVAKHGNRAVSSHMGSADILEALGYPLHETPQESLERLNKTGFTFLFAPSYHPAMKHAAHVRKELKVRTVFNLLGPLSNPTKAEIHVLGVFQEKLLDTMAKAIQFLGVKNALVVHSREGYDEISPLSKTSYAEIENQNITHGEIDPSLFGLSIQNVRDIQAFTADEGLAIAQGVLSGSHLAAIETVALNAAASEYLYEKHSGNNPGDLASFMKNRIPEIVSFIQSKKLKELTDAWK